MVDYLGTSRRRLLLRASLATRSELRRIEAMVMMSTSSCLLLLNLLLSAARDCIALVDLLGANYCTSVVRSCHGCRYAHHGHLLGFGDLHTYMRLAVLKVIITRVIVWGSISPRSCRHHDPGRIA